MMEVVIEPTLMESYNITFSDINTLLENNNQLIDRVANEVIEKLQRNSNQLQSERRR